MLMNVLIKIPTLFLTLQMTRNILKNKFQYIRVYSKNNSRFSVTYDIKLLNNVFPD